MDLIDAIREFPDELVCIRYLEKVRWPEGVRCLKCNSDRVTFMTTYSKPNKSGEQKARYVYQCKACRHQFTPIVGTLFNDTHLPLRTWFLVVALMIDAKKSIAANQVKRHLGIGSYRTAWYLCHRIRKAMEELPTDLFKGVVEADETYIGGKYDSRRKRERWDKEPVFGVIERVGKVKTWHIPSANRYHDIGKMKGTISPNVELVCTDESHMYKRHRG